MMDRTAQTFERCQTNRITDSKSLSQLFTRIPSPEANGIHWGAFFSKLSQLQKKPLRPLLVKLLSTPLNDLDVSQFTPGQLGQIAKGYGQSGLNDAAFIEKIASSSLTKIDEFDTGKELHMLLTGLNRLASQTQMQPLFTALSLKFTTAQYCDGASPATLAAWINTCIIFTPNSESTAKMLNIAEQRIEEFKVTEIGPLLTSLASLPLRTIPSSLLQACEGRLLSFQQLTPRTYATCLPTLGKMGFSSERLLSAALSECFAWKRHWDQIGVLFGAKTMELTDERAKKLALGLANDPYTLSHIWLPDQCWLLSALLFQLDETEYSQAHPLIHTIVQRRDELSFTNARFISSAIRTTQFERKICASADDRGSPRSAHVLD